MNLQDKLKSALIAEDVFNVLSPEEIKLCNIMSKIAVAIINKRHDMGMNQKTFSNYMNVSQGMISKWESAEYNFSIQSLIKVFEKLNIPLNSIFEDNNASTKDTRVYDYLKIRRNQYLVDNSFAG